MNRVIWLKTARVYATDSDMTAKVERSTVKLEDGDNWNKFIRYAPLKGYKKDEPPYVEKVMEKKEGKWVVIDPQPWIDQLNEVLAIKPMANEKIDFKALAERQANELKETKAGLKAMEERMRALEAKPAIQPNIDEVTGSGPENMIEPVLRNQDGKEITGSEEVPTAKAPIQHRTKPAIKRK